MSGDRFVQCVEMLAESLDGDRDVSERQLESFERFLMQVPRRERDELRRQMILIVAGLSRLEVRLIDADGPLNVAI